MKKTILILAINFFALQMYAQEEFAVIKDKDGYTNVREGGEKSKIVGKILQYQPFECMDSEDVGAKRIKNRVFISYEKYVEKSGYLQNDENTENDGYIHQSRVQRLADLPQLKKVLYTENKAVYKNDTITVTFEFAPFDYKKHVLKNDKGKIITKPTTDQTEVSFAGVWNIDGERVWGTDGTIPRTEIKSISITCKDKILRLPASSLKNIFQPGDNTRICIGTDGELYIWMQNGDGAAAYHAIWVIVGGELKYRYVQLGFYV